MAEETDLIWDHAADVQFDTSDMSRGLKYGHSTFYRPETVPLTFEQANELIQVLDTTREIIHSYLEFAEESHPTVKRTRCCVRWFPCLRGLGKCLPKISKNITVITIILQAFNIFILTLIDIWPIKQDYSELIAGAATMIILQLINLIALIYTSVVMAKLMIRRKVTAFMLAQNFFASLFLFSGLYTLTYRLEPHSWKFVQESLNSDPVLVVVLYAKFLFFSVSTATLCGSDNALPVEWYNCIFASVQMLLSFVYFASILHQAMTPKLSDIVKRPPSSAPPLIQSQRRRFGSISSRGSINADFRTGRSHLVTIESPTEDT